MGYVFSGCCWWKHFLPENSNRSRKEHTPGGSPKYTYERISFINRQLRVWGIFQGSVGVFLETPNPQRLNVWDSYIYWPTWSLLVFHGKCRQIHEKRWVCLGLSGHIELESPKIWLWLVWWFHTSICDLRNHGILWRLQPLCNASTTYQPPPES